MRAYEFIDLSKRIFKNNIRYLIGFVLLITTISICMAILDPIILRVMFDALADGENRKILLVGLKASLFIIALFILCYVQNCYCDIWLYRLVGHGNSESLIQYHLLPFQEKNTQFDKGDSFNRINQGVESIAYIWLFLSLIICNLISCIILSILAFQTSVWIIILSTIVFVITTIRTLYENRRNLLYTKKQQELEGIRETTIHGLIHNMEHLAMTHTVSLLKLKYYQERNEVWNIEKKRVYLLVWLDAVQEAIEGSLRCILILVLAPLRHISIGQVIASFALFESFYKNLSYLRTPISNLPQKIVPVRRLLNMLQVERNSAGDTPDIETESLIQVQNMSVYLGERHILKNINLEIKKGEKVALVGENGCGKSTLLRILIGLNPSESGICTIMGKATAHFTYDMKRSLMSYIPADSLLFSQSAEWNIKIGANNKEDLDNERYAKIVASLNISAPADRFMYQNGLALSGGQAQRVNIARALIHPTPIIFADEPESALDFTMGQSIIKQILSSAETVVVITHQPANLAYFDRIILLHEGGVEADGCMEEIKDNEHYKEWLGLAY